MQSRLQKKKGLLQAPSKNKKISLGGACRIVGARTSLRTPKISFGARNSFSKHDCVYWGIRAGIAQKIIQGVDGGGRCQFAGVFEQYAPVRGSVWASAGNGVVVVDAETLQKSRAYVRLDKRELHALSHRV